MDLINQIQADAETVRNLAEAAQIMPTDRSVPEKTRRMMAAARRLSAAVQELHNRALGVPAPRLKP